MFSVNKAGLHLSPKWSVPCVARTSRHPGPARVHSTAVLRPSARVIDDKAVDVRDCPEENFFLKRVPAHCSLTL